MWVIEKELMKNWLAEQSKFVPSESEGKKENE
jgi:hypothetical protein